VYWRSYGLNTRRYVARYSARLGIMPYALFAQICVALTTDSHP